MSEDAAKSLYEHLKEEPWLVTVGTGKLVYGKDVVDALFVYVKGSPKVVTISEWEGIRVVARKAPVAKQPWGA